MLVKLSLVVLLLYLAHLAHHFCEVANITAAYLLHSYGKRHFPRKMKRLRDTKTLKGSGYTCLVSNLFVIEWWVFKEVKK